MAERYVRNVEAVGSNPITSTKGPGQRAKVGAPGSYEALLSATGFVVELEDANPLSHERPSSQADSWMVGTVGGAIRRGVSLRVFIELSSNEDGLFWEAAISG